MSRLRRSAGRALRNLRRQRFPGIGCDFIADVKARLNLRVETIFDVGAYYGITALEFADRFPKANVYAFEPSQINFQKMRSNLVGVPDIKLFNAGMSSSPGQMPFNFHPAHPSMSRSGQGSETVEMDTIDNFCAAHNISRIDILKIDTEGHESDVLAGASHMLDRISLIKAECAYDPDNTYHTSLDAISTYLLPRSFRLFGIYDQTENPLISRPLLHRFDAAFLLV